MRQAIEEGFILDVLANYTTYRSYYELAKSIEDNPQFEVKSAQKRLRRHVEEHPQTIAAKAEIMVDHFLEQVVKSKRLKGQGRCMIVTKNIVAAIRYVQAVREVLRKRDSKVQALVAFTGKKLVSGVEHTEASLNGSDVSDIREAFDGDPYRILVVANKFLTGFDQPKLCAMYVDKPLAGVRAVQTLSRLNRAAPKYAKRTEDIFVLDYFNKVSDIQTAFSDYYTDTLLMEGTDLNVLHDLIDYLRPVGVFSAEEVRAFAKTYFSGADAQGLSIYLDLAEQRFSLSLKLDDKQQKDFKIKAKQFVKIYGQLASITPYEVPEWEEMYWYLKFLIPKLRVDRQNDELDDLLDSADLSTYGLERSHVSASITLDPDLGHLHPANANPRSVHDDGGRDVLDNIIAQFNETHFSDWSATAEEKRARLISVTARFTADPRFVAQYQATQDPSNRQRLKHDMLQDAVQGSRDESLDFYRLWATDEAFRKTFTQLFDRALEGGQQLSADF